MNRPFIIFSAVALLALTACETSRTRTAATQPEMKGQAQDFLQTGRGLSDGAVDLYQPGTDFLPTEQFPTTGRRANVSPIPGNSGILVSDPSVTIYSLDTMQVSEPEPAPLPPGLPALQPPVNLQEQYPSPFDENGNPTQ